MKNEHLSWSNERNMKDPYSVHISRSEGVATKDLYGKRQSNHGFISSIGPCASVSCTYKSPWQSQLAIRQQRSTQQFEQQHLQGRELQQRLGTMLQQSALEMEHDGTLFNNVQQG